jgi:hypothetical protein
MWPNSRLGFLWSNTVEQWVHFDFCLLHWLFWKLIDIRNPFQHMPWWLLGFCHFFPSLGVLGVLLIEIKLNSVFMLLGSVVLDWQLTDPLTLGSWGRFWAYRRPPHCPVPVLWTVLPTLLTWVQFPLTHHLAKGGGLRCIIVFYHDVSPQYGGAVGLTHDINSQDWDCRFGNYKLKLNIWAWVSKVGLINASQPPSRTPGADWRAL